MMERWLRKAQSITWGFDLELIQMQLEGIAHCGVHNCLLSSPKGRLCRHSLQVCGLRGRQRQRERPHALNI